MLSSSEDDDDAFDAFLASLKPTKKEKYRISSGSLNDFIVDDSHLSFEEDNSAEDVKIDKKIMVSKNKGRNLLESYINESNETSSSNSPTDIKNQQDTSSTIDVNTNPNAIGLSPKHSDTYTKSDSGNTAGRSKFKTKSDDAQQIAKDNSLQKERRIQNDDFSTCKVHKAVRILKNNTPKRSTASQNGRTNKATFSTPRIIFSSSDSDSDEDRRDILTNPRSNGHSDYTKEVDQNISMLHDDYDRNGTGESEVTNEKNRERSIENLCSDFSGFDLTEQKLELDNCVFGTPSDSRHATTSSVSPLTATKKKSKTLIYSDDSESDDDVIYVENDSDKENSGKVKNCVLSSDDDESVNDNVFLTPTPIRMKRPLKTNITPLRNKHTTPFKVPSSVEKRVTSRKDGLPPNLPPNCEKGIGFKRHRDFLTHSLYNYFNKTIFEEKLPTDMIVEWDKRLLKTAGVTKCSTQTKTIRDNGITCINKTYSAKICLSEKVLDSLHRLRDTLCHEMCHAAVWLIEKQNDGHGPFWKGWARRAMIAHPNMPMVTRCHSYDISYKFSYQCQMCRKIYGRHSKSIKVDRQVCGICKGRLVLLPSTNLDGTPVKSRTPNKFAMFVKDNYKTVQKSQSLGGVTPKHSDIMKSLSKQFAALSARK